MAKKAPADWTLTLWGFHGRYHNWHPLVHGYTEASMRDDLDEYPDETILWYSYFAFSKYNDGVDSPDLIQNTIKPMTFVYPHHRMQSPLPLVII